MSLIPNASNPLFTLAQSQMNQINELQKMVRELERKIYNLEGTVKFYQDLTETGSGCGREGCKDKIPHVH